MNLVAGPSPASNVLKRRLSSSSDDEERRRYGKKRYFYILEPAGSSSEMSDGPESIYSIQDKSTDRAKDTSDTCSKSDSASNLEYEVVSLSETESFFYPYRDSTDSPEDLRRLSAEEGNNQDAINSPSSGNYSPDEKTESGSTFVFKPWYINCLRCKEVNSHPYFKYCLRCYRLRKETLPERKIKRKKRPDSGRQFRDELFDSGVGSSQGVSITPDVSLADSSAQSCHKSDVDVSRGRCNICLERPKDGGFCHATIAHLYACYKCSVKVYLRSGRCPVCNNKARQIIRIIDQ